MKLRKFQMGGMMPEEAPMGAPAPEMGAPEAMAEGQPTEDPIAQLGEMAAQALQTQDPQMMAAVCEAVLTLLQGAGGGAPAPGGAPEEPVMMRKGGKMVYKKGAKVNKSKKKC